MPVREPHPLRREPVHVRRRDFSALRIVALHVAVTEIVGEDHDDVQPRRGRSSQAGVADNERSKRSEKQGCEDCECAFHGGFVVYANNSITGLPLSATVKGRPEGECSTFCRSMPMACAMVAGRLGSMLGTGAFIRRSPVLTSQRSRRFIPLTCGLAMRDGGDFNGR